MGIRITLVVAAALGSGCADLTHFKQDLGDPKTGISVDIKQRMMFRSVNPSDPEGWARICAEPSPDAISSLGASVGASLLRPSGSAAQLGVALNEAAAYTGLRTQSIQLMRDAMYRTCEAYMSGAIPRAEYVHLQRRFQAQVVGLLAIEQLTGSIAAPPVAVLTNAAAGAGGGAGAEADRLAQARKQLAEHKVKEEASRQAVDAAKAKIAKATPLADKARPKKPEDRSTEEKQALLDEEAAQKELAAATAQHLLDAELTKLYADALKVAEEDYTNAKSRVRASNTGQALVPTAVSARTVSDAAVAAVAGGVVEIVELIFNGAFNDANSRCLNKLIESAPNERAWLLDVCRALAEREEAAAKAREQKLSEVIRNERDQPATDVGSDRPAPPTKPGGAGDGKPAKPGAGAPPKSSSGQSVLGKAEQLARNNSQFLRAQAEVQLNSSTADALRKAQESLAKTTPRPAPQASAPAAPASGASAPARP